jgi:hypothetical protein
VIKPPACVCVLMVNVLYEPRFYQQLGDDEFLRLWILFLFYQLLRDFLRDCGQREFLILSRLIRFAPSHISALNLGPKLWLKLRNVFLSRLDLKIFHGFKQIPKQNKVKNSHVQILAPNFLYIILVKTS